MLLQFALFLCQTFAFLFGRQFGLLPRVDLGLQAQRLLDSRFLEPARAPSPKIRG
jgi:hypothetical protein